MESKLPEVSKGDAISADLFNALVRRINARDSNAEQTSPFQAKGEFWIRNNSAENWPAYKPIRINGFYGTYDNIVDAKSALANDSLLFACNTTGSGKYFAMPLESIPPAGVGRACFPWGAIYFLEAASGEAVVCGSRLSFKVGASTYGQVYVDPDYGTLVAVAFDSTSRLVAACSIPQPLKLRAGASVSITDFGEFGKEISAGATLFWGCWNGSQYDESGSVGLAPSGKMVFGTDFEGKNRQDGGAGLEVGLKTRAQQVITGVDFANKTVTTAWIKVLQ